jgi:hypothetical protein
MDKSDRISLFQYFRDKCVEREINGLLVHCTQKPCPWRGVLGDLQVRIIEHSLHLTSVIHDRMLF